MSVTISGDTGISMIADGIITTSKLADNAITSSKIASNAIDGSKISDGTISVDDLPTGSTIQVITRYDDTVSAAGSGTPNYTYWLDTYITLKRTGSKLIIDGVWTGHSSDDTSLGLQYNVNGGSWNFNSILNSQAYTYSGLADFSWSHRSNNGPFPVPLHNFLNCSDIGAVAGSVVGIRVATINENGTTYYNRGIEGADGSVNYATARSRMSLIEVRG